MDRWMWRCDERQTEEWMIYLGIKYANGSCCIPTVQELQFKENPLSMWKTDCRKYTAPSLWEQSSSVYATDFCPDIAALRSDFIL